MQARVVKIRDKEVIFHLLSTERLDPGRNVVMDGVKMTGFTKRDPKSAPGSSMFLCVIDEGQDASRLVEGHIYDITWDNN